MRAPELSDYFTADAMPTWTAPSEQGREDSELVKVGGKWLIERRYISSDSGLPDRFDTTFTQRDTPLDWEN